MIRASVMAVLLAAPAVAQQVQDCDWQASAWNIPEPWEDYSRTFSEGRTRIALLDTIEPAAGWAYLLVLSPPLDELGGRQCRVIGFSGMGFAGIDFDTLDATYDPATGLTFRVTVRIPDGTATAFPERQLWFTLNQATGEIVTGLER